MLFKKIFFIDILKCPWGELSRICIVHCRLLPAILSLLKMCKLFWMNFCKWPVFLSRLQDFFAVNKWLLLSGYSGDKTWKDDIEIVFIGNGESMAGGTQNCGPRSTVRTASLVLTDRFIALMFDPSGGPAQPMGWGGGLKPQFADQSNMLVTMQSQYHCETIVSLTFRSCY